MTVLDIVHNEELSDKKGINHSAASSSTWLSGADPIDSSGLVPMSMGDPELASATGSRLGFPLFPGWALVYTCCRCIDSLGV